MTKKVHDRLDPDRPAPTTRMERLTLPSLPTERTLAAGRSGPSVRGSKPERLQNESSVRGVGSGRPCHQSPSSNSLGQARPLSRAAQPCGAL